MVYHADQAFKDSNNKHVLANNPKSSRSQFEIIQSLRKQLTKPPFLNPVFAQNNHNTIYKGYVQIFSMSINCDKSGWRQIVTRLLQ